jgi:hypothetical protein
VTNRPVHLVFDTSAIAAYATTVDVGEMIGEVNANGAAFALPVSCLVEAAQILPDDAVTWLASHEAAVVVGDNPDGWRALVAMRHLLGGLDVAAALDAAERYDCDIYTTAPERYTKLGDEPPVLPL